MVMKAPSTIATAKQILRRIPSRSNAAPVILRQGEQQTSCISRRENAQARSAVIASAAKQSTFALVAPWIALLRSQ
jgi:hypothetical protein